MRKFVPVLALFFLLFTAAGVPAQDLKDIVGFDLQWMGDEGDLLDAQQIFISKVDMRALVKTVTYDEYDGNDFMGGTEEENFSSDLLTDIAQDLYARLRREINPVIAVNDEEPGPEAKGLTLDVELRGNFEYEDRGVLSKYLFGAADSSTALTLIFVLTDTETKNPIVRLTARGDIAAAQADKPLASDEDRERLSAFFDLWARRLANFLTIHVHPAE